MEHDLNLSDKLFHSSPFLFWESSAYDHTRMNKHQTDILIDPRIAEHRETACCDIDDIGYYLANPPNTNKFGKYSANLSSFINNNNNNNLVWWHCHRDATLQNVIQTQKCEPCQLNKPTTPFPAGGFPPDTASPTRPKAQAWPQFNRHALDNNGWV